MILDIKTPRVFIPAFQPYRYLGIHGGRGSGKSHFVAEKIIESHIMGKRDTVCVREIQKSLKQSVKKLLENKIESLNAGAYFDVLESEIRSKRGGLIIFQGMQNHTADSIKSLEGFDEAWVEEAQSLSQRSLDLLRPTIRKPDSSMIFSWNPDKETDPVDVLLRSEVPPPNSVVIEANYTDNPWFPEELRTEMEFDRARDFERYLHVWEGKYKTQSESVVFKNWRVDEFTAPDDAEFRFGADWGFAIDPTTLVRCYIIGRRLYVDYEAYMVGCEIQNTPDLFMQVPQSERWAITADSARPETIQYMRTHGFPKIMAAAKGPGSVEDGIEWLKSFDMIIHPRCVNLIKELKDYSYKIDKLTGKVLPLLEDKNNHLIDALRYACEGARRAGRQKERDSRIKTVESIPVAHRWR